MEGVTWCTHKYLMHGWLWNLHEDHHDLTVEHVFEKNDLFFLVFAIPSSILYITGINVPGLFYLLFIGIGISIYGAAYVLVHDLVIHRRFGTKLYFDNFYFKALVKAHKIHHKNMYQHESQCFGMLYVPMKYFKEAYTYARLRDTK